MFCAKCGNQLPDDVIFCPKCGTNVRSFYEREETGQKNKNMGNRTDETKAMAKRKGITVGSIILGIILVIVLGIVLVYMKKTQNIKTDFESMESEQSELRLQLYDVTQDSIDVYAENKQPNPRDFSMTWDRTLFYLLEDVSSEDNDGQIEKYDITKKELTNAQNGNQISYEIYTNPETGKMNKIVSVEDQGNILEITDYYYQDNGQPNFIYQRTDSIYTPTYATPDKTGERFYFNNDTLVRWRWINEPLHVEEIALTKDAQSFAQMQYMFNDLDTEKQDEYNQKEIQMLNAAYNTYAAMEKSSDYANLKGYVFDTTGKALKDATIEFWAGEESLGKITTHENGYYETGISLYNAGYNLMISCEGYEDVSIYGIIADKANVTNWMENIYLTPKVEQKCSVQLNIYDADGTSENENEMVSTTGVMGASIVVRKGVNNTIGKSVAKAESDNNGVATINLNTGVYTVEISANGYISSYETLTVDSNKNIDIPLVEKISDNQVKVVLTWDGNKDLDACLFTPYKAEGGNMAHIDAINRSDDYGNMLALDSKNGQAAEVITIADSTNGTYKYYVSDYNNCLNGNLTASDMLDSDVRVRVYDKNGIIETYTLPHNQPGVIWEVFEIKNGKIVTLQNIYANLEGKSWWGEDKNIKEKLSEVYLSYKDYLEQYENAVEGEQHYYALAYIDNDKIPELVIYDDYARNVELIMFNEYTDSAQAITGSLGGGDGAPTVYYIEGENLICEENTNCFFRYDTIYTVVNNEFKIIENGWGEFDDDGEFNETYGAGYAWYWDEAQVSEEDYYKTLSDSFEFSNAISFFPIYENAEVENVIDYRNRTDMLALLADYLK